MGDASNISSNNASVKECDANRYIIQMTVWQCRCLTGFNMLATNSFLYFVLELKPL